MAADLIFFYPTISPATLGGVIAACSCTAVAEAVATRLASVVSARMADLQPAAFLGFLATLLTGTGPHVSAELSADSADELAGRRHTALVQAACNGLRAIGDAGEDVCLPELAQWALRRPWM